MYSYLMGSPCKKFTFCQGYIFFFTSFYSFYHCFRILPLIENLSSQIISHRLKLAEGPDAYKHFDARDDGWTKVVLKPAA